MATFKVVNCKGKYFDADAKPDIIRYILSPEKTACGYCGYVAVDPQDPAASMNAVSERFGKADGVQLRHFIVSFQPGELTDPAVVDEIAQEAAEFFEHEYQTVYAVHADKPSLHFHLVINSVSYIDGHRYRGTRKEFYDFKNNLKQILRGYGIPQLQYISLHSDAAAGL